jgi:RNA polymerase sigma-70 factor (ECF subfamily)
VGPRDGGNGCDGLKNRRAAEAEPEIGAPPAASPGGTAAVELRLRRAVAQKSALLWRTLVRLGVRPADAEDAVQEVFLVLARHLNDVPVSAEKAFLLKTALGVASTRRRSRRRRPEQLDDTLEGEQDGGPLPDQLVARLRLRQTLQRLLDELPSEQRSAFVLVELEGLTAPEVAHLLALPLGTVASRLRRGRQGLLKAVARLDLNRELEEFEYG